MKKFYLFSILVLLIGTTSFGQNVNQVAGRQLNLTSYSEIALETPVSIPSAAAVGDTIWYDDFSDLSNWVTGSTGAGSSDLDWEQTTTGTSSTLVAGLGSIESITSSNGWAILDAIGNGTIDPTGAPTGVTFDSYLQMAGSVDLSSVSSVAVTFTEFYVEFQAAVYLEVSTDGSTWSSIQLHPQLQSNDQTANDATQYRDISSLAGGESTVWIRLRYQGGGVFWEVDDFMIVEGSSYDLDILNVFHANIDAEYEYSAIPLSQAQELSITTVSENDGSSDMANPIYSYTVANSGSGVVADSSFEASSNPLVTGGLDTTFFTTGFTPNEIGEYTLTVSVEGDSTDTSPSNNELSSVFFITDSIYGHDDPDNLTLVGSGASGTNPTPIYKTGLLYEIVRDVKLFAIQTVFIGQTGFQTTAESVTYDVYELAPGDNTPLSDLDPIISGIYDLQSGDVSSGNLSLVTIEIDEGNGVQLTAGNVYLVAIGNPTDGDNLVLLFSPEDADDASLRYGPYGVGGNVDWFLGTGNTPLIRLVLENISVGVQENEDVADVSLYPNPTEGMFRLTYTSKQDQELTFNVFDVNGALMFTEQTISNVGQKNSVAFDASSFAAGIYFVQIQGATTTLNKRVVVQ